MSRVSMRAATTAHRPALTTGAVVLTSAAVGALLFHAWCAATSGFYIGPVSGVWLALARDLRDGVFYRPIISDLGYGGTRYFPLYFSLIALLMRVGIPPVASAFAVSIFSAALLFAGVARLLVRLGLPRAPAIFFAVLALAPHWVQQTVFAIRCDILAVAFVVWGLSFVTSPSNLRARTVSPWLPAVFFTLAFATKPTSMYGAAVAIVVMAFDRDWRSAVRLCGTSAVGGIVFLVLLHVASQGRALESFRACSLAGGSVADLLRNLLSVRFGPLGGMRLLTVILGSAFLAWLFDVRLGWKRLPSVFFWSAALTTELILGSPGTVYANHVVDIHVASVIVLGAFSRRHVVARGAIYFLVLSLLVLASYQNAARAVRLGLPALASQRSAELERLSDAVGGFRRPVLSESPEYPVIAGTSAYLLDPFALRVITLVRPEVLRDIQSRLARHAFAYVLLTIDPESERGRGWYRNTHFGWPVMETLLANYAYRETRAGMLIYVPKEPPAENQRGR